MYEPGLRCIRRVLHGTRTSLANELKLGIVVNLGLVTPVAENSGELASPAHGDRFPIF
jgi:hypothetical protein